MELSDLSLSPALHIQTVQFLQPHSYKFTYQHRRKEVLNDPI